MIYRWAADLLALLHFGFVVFVIFGALSVLRWPKLIWLHLPAAVWGAVIEFGGWICPLTPLENWLRRLAGQTGYSGGFVENYLMPILYPDVLTRRMQIGLGLIVVVINLAIYAIVFSRSRRRRIDQSR